MIQRAMKREGNPGRTPDNRYRIADWQAFINQHFTSVDTNPAPDKLKLQNEKLVLEIETLRFKLQVQQREFSANTDIELWVGDMVMQAKRVLLKLPSALAPQVIGLTEVEAELLLKTEINAALAQLTSRPLHGVAAPAPLPLGGGHDYTSPPAAPAP